MKILMLMVTLFIFNGCAVKNVKPWEKGTLSKETMKSGETNALLKKFANHIYFSKEGSKGGGGVAGGGCGCN